MVDEKLRKALMKEFNDAIDKGEYAKIAVSIVAMASHIDNPKLIRDCEELIKLTIKSMSPKEIESVRTHLSCDEKGLSLFERLLKEKGE